MLSVSHVSVSDELFSFNCLFISRQLKQKRAEYSRNVKFLLNDCGCGDWMKTFGLHFVWRAIKTISRYHRYTFLFLGQVHANTINAIIHLSISIHLWIDRCASALVSQKFIDFLFAFIFFFWGQNFLMLFIWILTHMKNAPFCVLFGENNWQNGTIYSQ